MADAIFIPDMVDETDAGIFATQANRAVLPVIVAPTATDRPKAFNTIRKDTVVVACANLFPSNFAFDSSVVAPQAQQGFQKLAGVIRRHPGSPMSLFGHADPSGNDIYNKWLSERRARSIHAVMRRSVDTWEALYSDPQGASGDVWGLRAIQMMVDTLGFPPGNFDGKQDAQTAEAIAAALDQPPGSKAANTKATRAVIFGKYMDFLRKGAEGEPDFPELTDDDFLGGAKAKATFQGCSEFNPQFLMGREELQALEKAGEEGKASRDELNAPNRRVIVFLFAKGTKIDPAKWPCPAAAQGITGCTKRFWSNGKQRRETAFDTHRRRFGREVPEARRDLTPPNPELAKEVGREETTFGCRFYHGIALHSPCERDLRIWVLQIMIDRPTFTRFDRPTPPAEQVPLANRRFVAIVGDSRDAPVIRGRTTVNGVIGLPAFHPTTKITLKLDVFRDPDTPEPETGAGMVDSQAFPDEESFHVLRLDGGALKPLRAQQPGDDGFDPDFDLDAPPPSDADADLGMLQRLYNLGFGPDDTGKDFANWDADDRRRVIVAYQRDHKLEETGVRDEPTSKQLFEDYGS